MSGQLALVAQTSRAAPAPSWQKLRIAAEIFADFQQFRIAASNRAERGGVPPEEFGDLLAGLDAQERDLAKVLRQCYRAAVPEHVRGWQATTLGLGEHTFARLLGLLGDPLVAHPWHWEGEGNARHLVQDQPYERSISQLWSYCGVGDPARKRRSGMSVEDAFACGSPRIRSLLFVISEGIVKQTRSPYRRVYDDAKAIYAERVHAEPCVRCGPSGKPAAAGSPWSKAHQHAAAMRLVAKEILRDLWRVAGEDEANPDAKPSVEAPPSPATRDVGEDGHNQVEAHPCTADSPASLVVVG